MKPTIWIFSLEPLETRYTAQWLEHVPALIKSNVHDNFNIVQVDGVQQNSKPTPGAFLNFSDTNYWKSSQLCNFLTHHNNQKTSINDHFLFTDAWNPVIIQLKYMSELLGFNWTFHGLWHAGSYDPADFLGRLIGDKPWVRQAERSMFESFDHNYFATEFHIELFSTGLNLWSHFRQNLNKIIQSGWPMEYLQDTLAHYKNIEKKNTIVFPHRIAPEKQVEIFRDLAIALPQYEFIVCQDQSLTKDEYHKILGSAKLVFSANLQETLGISPYEGLLVDAIPMVPDRLSYIEMYDPKFKYPSSWTENFDRYQLHKSQLIEKIIDYMENYSTYVPYIKQQTTELTTKFFCATKLYSQFK
jgi:glycosyltransferase involved in cell wall biosynthesis